MSIGDVDLTVEGDGVAEIGPAGLADHAAAVEIDGRGFAVLPGFVDIHAHPSSEPMLKGLTDEVGSRQLYMSSLYEYLPLFDADSWLSGRGRLVVAVAAAAAAIALALSQHWLAIADLVPLLAVSPCRDDVPLHEGH